MYELEIRQMTGKLAARISNCTTTLLCLRPTKDTIVSKTLPPSEVNLRAVHDAKVRSRADAAGWLEFGFRLP